IRQGVTFHDGTPLTAKDVAWTLSRVIDKNVASPMYSRLEGRLAPDGIKVIDDHTLAITLRQPDSGFVVALGQRYPLIVKDVTSKFTLDTALGTGPFKIKALTPGQSWQLERNPSYWQQGLPHINELRGVVISEQTTKLQSVLAGNSQLGDSIDYSSAPSV